MELDCENYIDNRFPALVANMNQDSDELFDSLLSSNNINFTRSRTCLMDDFQLHHTTPLLKSSMSMTSLNSIPSKLKSRTSLQNESHDRLSKTICSSSSKSPLKPISSNALDRFKPRNVEKCSTTCFSSQRNHLNQSSESRPSPYKNSLWCDTNDESCNSSKVSFQNTPTHSPHSNVKYSPFKLDIKETDNIGEAVTNKRLLKSCLKEKQKEVIIPGSPVPLQYITFRNKSSQKKENCMVSSCNSVGLGLGVTEDHSLANKFSFVSACNSSPIPANFRTIESPNPQYDLLKTPVGRRSQSFLKTPNSRQLKGVARSSNNNTPTLSCKTPQSSKALTGVKKLQSSISKRISLQLPEKNSVSKRISVNKEMSLVEDDDLPCTQPISEIILRGVVAYVEIRAENEYRNEGVKAELEAHGAKVEKNFTKKVTHCFFRDGRMSTYKRAIDWKVPLVCVLWIEACKAELRQVPLKGYEPYGIDKFKEALSLYHPRTRIRRAVTDSKVLAKLRKTAAESDKTEPSTRPLGPSSQTGQLINALHSVADDLRKATHQFEQILTSPVLQKRDSKTNPTSPRISEKESSEEIFETKKKRNKKLIFASCSDATQNKPDDDKSSTIGDKSSMIGDKSSTIDDKSSMIDDSDNEIRVSYDSDDLLVYARKQAANMRCSAPARLLTSRKCKKLLTSCQKAMENNIENKNSCGVNPLTMRNMADGSKRNSKNLQEKGKISTGDSKIGKDIPKTRKRKLMVPLQVIAAFEQDSSESISESSDVSCPYKTSPNKKHKSAKFAKPQPVAAVLSDWESDDSLTRAARRESSALFVKKEKKVQGHRFVPTIVCTSLSKSDVEVVASIAATLGRFAVESVVSERTTHVVTSSSRRTINLLKGVARGCWVLNVKWVYESLEAGKWLHEEKFELTAFSPAVKQSRLERQAFGPEFSLELFNSVGPVYVCRSTSPPAPDLAELLRLCGGAVVGSARAARIVVGLARPFSPTFSTRRPLVVTERWVLDSVTRLSLLNPRDYAINDMLGVTTMDTTYSRTPQSDRHIKLLRITDIMNRKRSLVIELA